MAVAGAEAFRQMEAGGLEMGGFALLKGGFSTRASVQDTLLPSPSLERCIRRRGQVRRAESKGRVPASGPPAALSIKAPAHRSLPGLLTSGRSFPQARDRDSLTANKSQMSATSYLLASYAIWATGTVINHAMPV